MQNDLISRSALIDQLEWLAAHEGDWRQSCILGIVRTIDNAPAIDAVERKKLIKKMFPMGVPKTREEWNYSINAKAVYEAIMRTEG